MGIFDTSWDNGIGTTIGPALSGLAGLYGSYQGMQTANNTNNQVQQGIAQNSAATTAQIQQLEAQIAANRQQAQDMYQRSLGDVTAQNQGLEGNIGTMTANLNALSDPNSPYMQMARQAIERKDQQPVGVVNGVSVKFNLQAPLLTMLGNILLGLINPLPRHGIKLARTTRALRLCTLRLTTRLTGTHLV